MQWINVPSGSKDNKDNKNEVKERLDWIKGNRVEMGLKIWFKNSYRGGQLNMQWQAVP